MVRMRGSRRRFSFSSDAGRASTARISNADVAKDRIFMTRLREGVNKQEKKGRGKTNKKDLQTNAKRKARIIKNKYTPR